MDNHTCDAHMPGYELRPPIGARSLPCVLPADHWDDHRNAAGTTWANLSEETCDAAVPEDLAAGLSGDAAEGCLLPVGHARWTPHNNAYVSWPARSKRVPRTELILALMDSLSVDDLALLRPFLRLAEMARPDAPDAELLAVALASLDGMFGALD
ncbi:hypothetical protein OG746_29325 [Streptomyces sp. NBC_01016]|uniref:hypothetical protein n=1 Tax=Streptomyces sp. NBC_01016 TaxID=2903720 RepID=UPI0022546B19|nr:hypothetical protein [Streptomyces sp. NBC_01016]MCX4832840.1 hypothetical protein [Streptomyces sp. NBC_01016]